MTKWILMLCVFAGSCSAFGQTAVPLKVYISADMLEASRFFNAIGFLSVE